MWLYLAIFSLGTDFNKITSNASKQLTKLTSKITSTIITSLQKMNLNMTIVRLCICIHTNSIIFI